VIDTVEQQEFIDCTPSTGIFHGYHNDSSMSIEAALSEFIDNSLDAGATGVTIVISPSTGEIGITDDGSGISDFVSMLRLGNFDPKGGIGRYGIGFNRAAIWLAPCVTIRSVRDGICRTVAVDWDMLENWKVRAPTLRETRSKSRTEISFSRLRQVLPRNLSNMCKTLQKRYPLLENDGKFIEINGNKIPPLPLPKLSKRMVRVDEYDGRLYRLTAGVLSDGRSEDWRSGFTVMLRERVMASAVRDGCGEYSASRFFGLVELVEGGVLSDGARSRAWPVDQIKTGLPEYIRLFLESLEEYVRPLLEEADEQSRDIRLRALENSLSGDWLKRAVEGGKSRQRRDAGESTGRVNPVGTDRKLKNPDKVWPDDTGKFEGPPRSVGCVIKLRFDDLGPDMIAEVTHNSKRTFCVLNSQHPFVIDNRSKDAVMRLLLAEMVLSYWLDDDIVGPRIIGQLKLPMERHPQLQYATASVLAAMAVDMKPVEACK
jgi:hypothetical protein